MILFDPNQNRLATLAMQLSDHGIRVEQAISNEETLADLLNKGPAFPLLADDSLQKDDLIYLREKIGVSIVVMTDGMDLHTWQELKSKRIPVLKRPITVEKVKEALQGYSLENTTVDTKKTGSLREIVKPSLPSEDLRRGQGEHGLLTSSPPISSWEGESRTFRQVVAPIYATKGGVGKTTIAVNFAASCAQHPQINRVCLVDADSQFGDVARILNQKVQYTLYDLTQMLSPNSTWAELEHLLSRHSSGFYYISAPRDPREILSISHEQMVQILQLLKRFMDVVVVDLSPSLTDLTVAAFDEASHVYLVGTTDIVTLNEVSDFIQLLPKLKMDRSKVKLIMNRCQKNNGIKLQDVKEALPLSIVTTIPEDINIQKAANYHQIVSLKDKRNPLSQGMADLQRDIHLYQIEKKRASIFAKWFGKKEAML